MRFLLLFLAEHHKHSEFPDVPSAAQTLLVAADAAVDLFRLPFSACSPIRVCQKLAAHGGALDASAGELLLHKIRVVRPPTPQMGQVGVLPHLIAEFEERIPAG